MHTQSTPTLTLFLTLCAALVLAGCGDDGGSTNNDTTDTASDTAPDTTGDTTPDTDMPGDTPTPDTDMVGMFTWPATTGEYTGGQTAYLSALTIPEVDAQDGPACCKDWGDQSRDKIQNGTDKLDNALAELNGLLGAFDLDLGVVMNERITDGTLVVLWDHFELDGADDDSFIIAALLGEFDDATDPATAAAGTGGFNVFGSSFVPGTGEPLVVYDNASMASGAMMAGPSSFPLQVDLTNISLDVSIADAEITGDATIGSGVSYANGTLGGYITLVDLAEVVNDYLLSDTCACLNITAPVYTLNPDGSIGANCVTDAHTLCTEETNSTCATMADATETGTPVCSILPSIMEGLADIDLDGDCATTPMDCSYEGLSVGLEWTAVPGQVSGIAQ